jgi:putative DNA-invertase from lambdoid prophage Rac
MKVYGYCRVSTAEQANSGLSLETQQQQITGYAMMKNWQVAEFFIEAGVSGSVPLADRPEGQRLLASLEPGDVVVTAKLDRAFRSAADALGTLEQLKEDRVGLHMIDLGGDVTGNGISKLVFTILSAVAENERDRIRERVRDVKRHRASQRLFNGGKRPFGYDIEGEGKNRRLVINADEYRAIQIGQWMLSQGHSLRKVAAAWKTECGLPEYDAKSVARILVRPIPNEETEMEFVPDEIVTLYGRGPMELHSAINEVMALPPAERSGATIFRSGNPSILDLAHIEGLAADWSQKLI